MMTHDEFAAFDRVVRKVLTVSHDELKRREKRWKQQRTTTRRSKRAVSRVPGGKG